MEEEVVHHPLGKLPCHGSLLNRTVKIKIGLLDGGKSNLNLKISGPINAWRHVRVVHRLLLFFLWFCLKPMADVDLNEPINRDDLEDFDEEARHVAGDFFFEMESDEG